MSDTPESKKPTPVPVGSFSSTQNYPKIVLMHAQEDELKNKAMELYVPLYVKLHDIYKTDQIFALAYQAAVDFESYWKELKTRVNVNFEDEIRQHAGDEALKELKKMTKEKENAKRKSR